MRYKFWFMLPATCIWHTARPLNPAFFDLFNKYKRPITILDVRQESAEEAAYALQNNAVVIVFCTNQGKIQQLLALNAKDRLIIFNQEPTRLVIQKLVECEHFDITLAQDHEPNNIEDLKNLGDYLICQQTVFAGTRKNLVRRHIFWHLPTSGKSYEIESTFEQKKLIKKLCSNSRKFISDWIAGINLLTFVAYNHVYPNNDTVLGAVEHLAHYVMTDWGPANMVIRGRNVCLIDFQDFHFYGSTQAPDHTETVPASFQAITKKYLVLIKKLLTTTDNFEHKAFYYWDTNAPGFRPKLSK